MAASREERPIAPGYRAGGDGLPPISPDASPDALDLPALLVGAAETVGQELGQDDLLLADEALLGQTALAEQVERGAKAGGGGLPALTVSTS